MATEIQQILPSLAVRINAEHEAGMDDISNAFGRYVTTGKLLIEAKAHVPHGKWAEWVEENCRFSTETAARYVRVAKSVTRDGFGDASVQSLQQALKMLAGEAARRQVALEGPESDTESEGDDDDETTEAADPTVPVRWTRSERSRKKEALSGHTVLANLHRDAALIAWAKAEGRLLRIDRNGLYPLGNPMKVGDPLPERSTVVGWYRDHWLPYIEGLVDWDALAGGKVLACWCYPEECHGDVILEELHDLEGGDS